VAPPLRGEGIDVRAEGGAIMEQRHWQPTSRDNYEEIVGRDVYTHDGELIGRVERIVHPLEEDLEQAHLGHFVVVRPDFFDGPLGDEIAYIPETNIVLATPDAVELNVDRREIPNQDWANLPVNPLRPTEPPPEEIPINWFDETDLSGQARQQDTQSPG
jgi:hypothetical protein